MATGREERHSQGRVRFQEANLGVSIHDYVLGIRHTIPYDASLCLANLRRFHGDYSRKSKIVCKASQQRVKPNLPLESQGVAPGDVLCIYSAMEVDR